MAKPLASVVFATYNRWHLLKNSIECYNRVRFPLDRLELIVVDDASTDETTKVLDTVDPRIDLKYIRLRKQPGLWRDCGAVINVGIRTAKGAVVIPTHPEIMPGRDSIQAVCDLADQNTWVSCKGYYASPRDQERLDTVDWVNEGPLAVRRIEGFYDRDQHTDSHPDYTPWAIEAVGNGGHRAWLSWIFAGTTRKLWSWLGGFHETSAWGAIDMTMLNRRNRLGIRTLTPTADDAIVLHQNHDTPVGDFVPTNRDMQAAFAGNPLLLTKEDCHFPAVDELWGPYP